MATFIGLMDQQLNMLMDIKNGVLMVNVIGSMDQQLNMAMEVKYGMSMINVYQKNNSILSQHQH